MMIAPNHTSQASALPAGCDDADDICRRASHLLSDRGYSALRHVVCEHRQGKVTLRGRVPSFYLKQLAQTVVQSVPDVIEVDNRIEVG